MKPHVQNKENTAVDQKIARENREKTARQYRKTGAKDQPLLQPKG